MKKKIFVTLIAIVTVLTLTINYNYAAIDLKGIFGGLIKGVLSDGEKEIENYLQEQINALINKAKNGGLSDAENQELANKIIELRNQKEALRQGSVAGLFKENMTKEEFLKWYMEEWDPQAHGWGAGIDIEPEKVTPTPTPTLDNGNGIPTIDGGISAEDYSFDDLNEKYKNGEISQAEYEKLNNLREAYLMNKLRKGELSEEEKAELNNMLNAKKVGMNNGNNNNNSGDKTIIGDEELEQNDKTIARTTFSKINNGARISLEFYHQLRSLFCIGHGIALPSQGDTRVESLGVEIPVVEEGQKYRVNEGTPGCTSKTLPKYEITDSYTAGKDNLWALAYILSFWQLNDESGNSEVQNAVWAIKNEGPQKVSENDLAKEAKKFEDYKQRVYNDGGYKTVETLKDQVIAYDTPSGQIISGPYSIHYQRGFAKEGSREKVEFGGIEDINVYDEFDNVIDKSLWRIEYDSEHSDSQQNKEDDEGYGDEGYESFYYYPYPDEEFNIVFDAKSLGNITRIGKIEIKYFDMDYFAEIDELRGKFAEINWVPEHDVCTAGYVEHKTEKRGKRTVNITIRHYCPHGLLTHHNYNFRLVANGTNQESQPFINLLKSEVIRHEYIKTIVPQENLPPENPPIEPPEGPSVWPPDYPTVDYPPIIDYPPDFPTPDFPTPDFPTPDIPTPDFPTPDIPTPDIPTPDIPTPDIPTPDIPTPTPDVPTPTPTPGIELKMKIAGVVWEDEQSGKESEFDGVIGYTNNGTKEKGMEKIKVTLYKYGTKEPAEAKKNPVYTDSKGSYIFTEVPMGKYDVEFEYDGMNYTTVEPFAGGSAGDYQNNPNNEIYRINSKAAEVTADRDKFNSKFEEIYGDQAMANGKTYGHARGSEGVINLEYNSKDGISILITKDNQGYVKKEFAMTVRTSDQGIGYPFYDRYVKDRDEKTINGNLYEANYPYMLYVNLGLKKRPNADFAVMKDVQKAVVTINKKKLEYKYNRRAEIDGFEARIKRTDAEYRDMVYNRVIYDADYKFRLEQYALTDLAQRSGVTQNDINAILGTKKAEEDELQVFVTYYLKIKNQSEQASGIINEIADFYDKTYNLIDDNNPNGKYLPIQAPNEDDPKSTLVAQSSYYYTDKDPTNHVALKWNQVSDTNGFKKMTTNGLKGVLLQPGESINLFVTFEVDKAKTNDRTIKIGENINHELTNKYNHFEIVNFTTKERDGSKLTGQVDADSAPGNYNPKDANTKEDDSDSAPTMKIYVSSDKIGRTLNGIVWEDERTKEIKETGQRLGDGIRQDNEKKINGVTVQLVEYIKGSDGAIHKYPHQEFISGIGTWLKVNNQGKIDTNKISKNDGEYEFTGYMPGNYVVRFKYGDTERTVNPNHADNNNKTSYNGHDYKSTAYQKNSNYENNLLQEWYNLRDDNLNNAQISDAKDDIPRRLEVIAYSKDMIFKNAKVLNTVELGETDFRELIEKTNMYADTAKLKVEVEFDTQEISDYSEANQEETLDYDIKDIDFGLEQRPINDMSLEKRIIGIQIVRNTGETLIDTPDKEQNVNWSKKAWDKRSASGKIHRQVTINLDDEVLQGSSIRIRYGITVKNTGEVDSYGKEDANGNVTDLGKTYFTGEYSDADKIVTTSYNRIIDYVDNDLVFRKDDNADWMLIEHDDVIKSVKDMKDIYLDPKMLNGSDQIENKDNEAYTQIIVSRALEHANLYPIENKKVDPQTGLKPKTSQEVQLVLSKTLGANDKTDDMTYDNMAEIIEFTNKVGRKSDIPGNHAPTDQSKGKDEEHPIDEDDYDYTETVVITPPTGGNKSTTYLIIGAVALIAVAGVAIVIRHIIEK